MIREKISELLRSFDADVKNVVVRVILLEHARLDTKNRGEFTTRFVR